MRQLLAIVTRLGVNGAADGWWRPDASPTQPRQAGGGSERLEWGLFALSMLGIWNDEHALRFCCGLSGVITSKEQHTACFCPDE
jgi:hypothetical protein